MENNADERVSARAMGAKRSRGRLDRVRGGPGWAGLPLASWTGGAPEKDRGRVRWAARGAVMPSCPRPGRSKAANRVRARLSVGSTPTILISRRIRASLGSQSDRRSADKLLILLAFINLVAQVARNRAPERLEQELKANLECNCWWSAFDNPRLWLVLGVLTLVRAASNLPFESSSRMKAWLAWSSRKLSVVGVLASVSRIRLRPAGGTCPSWTPKMRTSSPPISPRPARASESSPEAERAASWISVGKKQTEARIRGSSAFCRAGDERKTRSAEPRCRPKREGD